MRKTADLIAQIYSSNSTLGIFIVVIPIPQHILSNPKESNQNECKKCHLLPRRRLWWTRNCRFATMKKIRLNWLYTCIAKHASMKCWLATIRWYLPFKNGKTTQKNRPILPFCIFHILDPPHIFTTHILQNILLFFFKWRFPILWSLYNRREIPIHLFISEYGFFRC